MGLLNLSKPVEFEGVSAVCSVFYDDQCGHVISVRSGGVTGLVVRSLAIGGAVLTMRLTCDQGSVSSGVVSVKLSPSHCTLSVQRHVNTVTLIPVSHISNNSDHDHNTGQYSQQVNNWRYLRLKSVIFTCFRLKLRTVQCSGSCG